MNFSVNSTNAISSYSWNFGDGNTSNLSNPSNTYTSVGTYTVSVVVTDHFGCSVTLTYVITINPNAVYSITESDIKVYPNPFSTFIQLDLGSIKGWENMNLRLNNTLGQIIQTWSINNNGTNQFKIDLPEQLAAGIYYLDLKLDDNQYRLKLRKD
ncbi:MAG: PKD domain-containing protein [Chitinophagaceae bacterium]|nr:PKD domain-containing protein [Chitinophagaceae bacterium]